MLGLAGLVITLAVYGAVALIVKADDVGLAMATNARLEATRALGRAIVRGMPGFTLALTVIGTAAMIWVGGNILVHAVGEIVWYWPYDVIKAAGASVSEAVGTAKGFVNWLVVAALDGVVGLAIGMALIPLVGMLPGKSDGH